MRIFVSHASKNGEIVLKFAKLLEMVSSDIEVFCSSEKESIMVGMNFVKTIFTELQKSDLFIPIISKEYYESRFCMIELGVAFSYLYNQYNNRGEEYIFPFVISPVQKGEALSNTPMADIQTGSLCDESDIHSFFEYLSNERNVKIGTGLNQKLHSFIIELRQIYLGQCNVLKNAKIGAYFDDGVYFRSRQDIVSIKDVNGEILIQYDMNPYKKQDEKFPNFISVALRYADKMNFTRYLELDEKAEFQFTINDSNNSLKRIFVEFKFYPNNDILDTFEFSVQSGENAFGIPLGIMRSNALSNISEVCFVIHPDDVLKENGGFGIEKIVIG